MARHTRRRRSAFGGEDGSIAILFALIVPVVVGFLGLGGEVVYWQFTQRTLQSAADAAAFSGAAQLAQGHDEDHVRIAAGNAARLSGIMSARADTPIVTTPPSRGPFSGDTKAVEVVLVDRLPRLFTGAFFSDSTKSISVRAVARTAGARPACVLALHRSMNGAVSFGGSSTLELEGCDVASNSLASNSIDFYGATHVTTECVSAVGGIEGNDGRLTLTDCRDPFEGTRVFADPYADLPLPSPGICDSTLKSDLNNSPSTTVTVAPGTVCASGSGGSTVSIKGDTTFSPGIYIFNGVDLSVNSSAIIRGTGVTFVFTGGSTIHMNGGADIQLTAPTDSANLYHGVLFFGDKIDNVDHVLNGNSATSFTGALYFPGSNVSFSGTNAATSGACTILVAETILFTGNSFFGSDCLALGVEPLDTAQVVLIVE
ncbi:pilus assembly protein TadG-related protein [Parvularcula sp. LCG005]|uniref:pilus assembly protein TadG-related protein n=1 Tax=Parvularcula sp. LCG005 TaxID=3078805 RepID=UPI002943A267|nr:pilus assembly protein TadG-related protein [Parvularcula sp. LCG005]WOI53014.1 pilus assembly protein TadG-related protein [Parvularcula sp. LCG005]